MVKPETQFSVFLVNKPGVLAQVVQALAEAKVNILALTMMDSVEHGVLRMVVEQPETCREVLKRLNVPVAETEVVAVDMPNRPGAMADLLIRLSDARVPLSYAYVTVGSAKGGKAMAILKVGSVDKALRVLEDRRTARKTVVRDVRAKPGAVRR